MIRRPHSRQTIKQGYFAYVPAFLTIMTVLIPEYTCLQNAVVRTMVYAPATVSLLRCSFYYHLVMTTAVSQHEPLMR